MICDITQRHTPQGIEWYHDHCRDSDSLLITVGDSWTWGDSLGRTSCIQNIDDRFYRVDKIYGSQMSRELMYDHVNIGLPGQSNLDMLQYFKMVWRSLRHHYSRIQVIFTLTEPGRDLNGGLLRNRSAYDALRGEDWPRWTDLINGEADTAALDFAMQEMTHRDIDFRYHLGLWHRLQGSHDALSTVSNCQGFVLEMIQDFLQHLDVEWWLAMNFSSLLPENKHIAAHRVMDQRWCDVIARRGDLDAYPDPVFVISNIAITPLIQACQHLRINDKPGWIAMTEYANRAVDWLDRSPYNCKEATRHPLETAHQWWAEYLMEEISA